MFNAAHSNITIAQSTFRNNINNRIKLTFNHCNITIVSSTFIDNDGKLVDVRDHVYEHVGSRTKQVRYIIDVQNSSVSIYDTNFIGNKANKVLNAFESVVSTDNSTFKHNHGSAMDLNKCKVDVFDSVFNNNKGALSTVINIHGSEFKENVGESRGGAIKCIGGSLISFSETCTLINNQAG